MDNANISELSFPFASDKEKLQIDTSELENMFFSLFYMSAKFYSKKNLYCWKYYICLFSPHISLPA